MVVAWTDLVVQVVTITLSVGIGSALSYFFAIRTSRKERTYDHKVSKYEKFLRELRQLKNALLLSNNFVQYDPTQDPQPAVTVAGMFGFAGMVIDMQRIQVIAVELKGTRRVPQRGSQSRAFAGRVRDRLVVELGPWITRHARTVEDLALELAIIGSEAVKSGEYARLQADLETVGQAFVGRLLERLGEPFTEEQRALAQQATERIPSELDAVIARVVKEVEQTL